MADEQGNFGRVVFCSVKDLPETPINQSPGHAHDQGWIKRVASKAVNGSPDLIATIFRMGQHEYHPLHAHPNMGELYFVLDGTCEFRIGDETRHVGAHTAVYVPRGTPHSLRTRAEEVEVLIVFPEGDRDKVGKIWFEEKTAS